MSWMFWKKDKKESITREYKAEVSVPTLTRWHLYDAPVGSPNKIAAKIGLLPISEEVEEAEIEESESRVAQVEPYFPFLNVMSTITAQILSAAQKDLLLSLPGKVPAEDAEKVAEFLSEVYEDVAFVALYAAFSSALALEIIKPPEALEIQQGEEHDLK